MKLPKVLLVDDEEEFVETVVERLEFRGIPAKGVTTGKEAIQCLKSEAFDVVIADLKMPGVDGLQIKEFVELNYPQIRVILVTGHGAQDPDETVSSESETDVLIKPFGIQELLSRIGLETGRTQHDSG